MPKKKPALITLVTRKAALLSRMLNSGQRQLPSFLIIGTAKGGTTSLFRYLEEHPDVATPVKKEISFFCTHYHRGITWYRSHFPLIGEMNRMGKNITGEASPYYLSHPLAPERVQSLLPDVRLIVLLRNPVERAISNYKHIRRLGFEPESFENAIKLESERTAGEEDKIISIKNYFSLNHQYHSYLNRGVYWKELERWFKYFPRKSFLIINSETFYHAPEESYRRVLDFLQLSHHTPEEFVPFNKSKDNMVVSAETIQWLEDYFRPHNEKLFELIGERYEW
jgi:lipopolysaccharide transport system ATP-binding protein